MSTKVLFLRSGNKSQHPITQNQGDSLVEVGCEVFYFNVVGKGLVGYLGNLHKLREIITAVKPDVIHAHYSLCGFLATLAFSRVPVVVSLMGSDVISSSAVYRCLIRFFGFFFWRKVIVKSKEMYDVLGLSKAAVVPNGVNEKDFYKMDRFEARKKLGWPMEMKIALFASDPKRREKNYELFSGALLNLKEKGINMAEMHLTNLTKQEMNLYYNASDVLVLTSFHEGSPNVIKEAMFCDCPFVSVSVGDVDLWAQMTTGNFVVGYDVEEISRSICFAVDSSHLLNNELAVESLKSVKIAGKLKEIYCGLIGNKQ